MSINNDEFADVLSASSIWIVVGFIVFLFPILFRLIFDQLPFELLRQRLRSRSNTPALAKSEVVPDAVYNDHTDVLLQNYQVLADINSPSELLARYATSSGRVAQKIFTRAGVYLLIGVLVAFSGLGFFYAQTTSIQEIADWRSLLPDLVPKFGILFFIQFIAFFFLRQYRSAMEDFRYYEAIQRRREELLALIRLYAVSEQEIDITKLLADQHFYSTAGRLTKDETTEVIEARKLEKDEMVLFEKMIEIVGRTKQTN
ncbi:MAG: hypothetical protein AAGB13_13905 [Cyanobacteria bacterium P01_F01_bin.33]